MDKPELVERLRNQRLRLSEVRTTLRLQMKKSQRLDYPEGAELPDDFFNGNPIIVPVIESERGINLAFMWLGKALFFLGGDVAYKHSYDPGNKIIEAPKDVSDAPAKEYPDPNAMLKSLRAELKGMENEILFNLSLGDKVSLQVYECFQNAFTNFTEATMFLGVGLGNLRDYKAEGVTWRKPGGPDEVDTEVDNEMMSISDLVETGRQQLKDLKDENDASLGKKDPAGEEGRFSGSEAKQRPDQPNTLTLTDFSTKPRNSDEGNNEGRTDSANTERPSESGSGKNSDSGPIVGGQGHTTTDSTV